VVRDLRTYWGGSCMKIGSVRMICGDCGKTR
jgi:hypothetical protein